MHLLWTHLWSLQIELQVVAAYFYAFMKVDLPLPRVGGFVVSAESVSHRCAPQWPSDMIFSPRILLFGQIQVPFAFLGIAGAIAASACLCQDPSGSQSAGGSFLGCPINGVPRALCSVPILAP